MISLYTFLRTVQPCSVVEAIVVLLLSCISCCCVKLYRIRRERRATRSVSVRMQETIVTLWEAADCRHLSTHVDFYGILTVFFIYFCFYCLFILHQRSRKPQCALKMPGRLAKLLACYLALPQVVLRATGRRSWHHTSPPHVTTIYPLHIISTSDKQGHSRTNTKDHQGPTPCNPGDWEALICSVSSVRAVAPTSEARPESCLDSCNVAPSAKMANSRNNMFEQKPGTTLVNKDSSTPQLNIPQIFKEFSQSTGEPSTQLYSWTCGKGQHHSIPRRGVEALRQGMLCWNTLKSWCTLRFRLCKVETCWTFAILCTDLTFLHVFACSCYELVGHYWVVPVFGVLWWRVLAVLPCTSMYQDQWNAVPCCSTLRSFLSRALRPKGTDVPRWIFVLKGRSGWVLLHLQRKEQIRSKWRRSCLSYSIFKIL